MSSGNEFNTTGIDYADRRHLGWTGPIVDFHAHVMVTRPGDPANGPPTGEGPGASSDQAARMFAVADEFGIGPTVSMCLPDDIPILRERFGDRILFNGPIQKRTKDEPDDSAYRLLDRYLEAGVVMIKFWSAPRGRDRGLVVDAPWRIEAAKRARAAGVRLVMVHVADPDVWFRSVYADSAKFGTKADQYTPLRRMLELFPDMTFIAAHMGGDPEHPDHLEALLEAHPNLHFDTSATKWQIREVSPRRDDHRALIERHPDRFLFGTDLVTRHFLEREHYVSRYWCQRTLWESRWTGPSPIADPDHAGPVPLELRGVGLSAATLEAVYHRNAFRLLGLSRGEPARRLTEERGLRE